jgi:hypothetical protein
MPVWGRPHSSVPPSKARRCTTRLLHRQRSDQKCTRVEQAVRPGSKPTIENRPPPLYKSQYGPRARHPSNPRPRRSTPRPHHHRRRPAPRRSSRSNPLHQPPRFPKPGRDGSGSGHRSSRPPVATPPPSRPPPRRAIFHHAIRLHPSTTPPERRRRSLRHSRRLRRRPPPEPSADADLRPSRRNLLRHQRRNSPKSPPQSPPLTCE